MLFIRLEMEAYTSRERSSAGLKETDLSRTLAPLKLKLPLFIMKKLRISPTLAEQAAEFVDCLFVLKPGETPVSCIPSKEIYVFYLGTTQH
jgi:hypothetical protein